MTETLHNRRLGENSSSSSASVDEGEERGQGDRKRNRFKSHHVIYGKMTEKRNWSVQLYSWRLQHSQEANHMSSPKSYYRFLITRLVFLLQLQINNSILKL